MSGHMDQGLSRTIRAVLYVVLMTLLSDVGISLYNRHLIAQHSVQRDLLAKEIRGRFDRIEQNQQTILGRLR